MTYFAKKHSCNFTGVGMHGVEMNFKKIDIRFVYLILGIFFSIQNTALFAAVCKPSCQKKEVIKRFLTYPDGIQNTLETIDLLIISYYEQEPDCQVKESWDQRIMQAHECIQQKCSELVFMLTSCEESDEVTKSTLIFCKQINFQIKLMYLIENVRALTSLKKEYDRLRADSLCRITTNLGTISYYKNNPRVTERLVALNQIRHSDITGILQLCVALAPILDSVQNIITPDLKVLVPQIISWAKSSVVRIMRIEQALKADLGIVTPFERLASAILKELPADVGVNSFE
jgi:hypothetical protein